MTTEPETLRLAPAQGTLRWTLGGRVLHGGDLIQVCCSGGWITGRFEVGSDVDAKPLFYFSIELGGGKVAQQFIEIPEGALVRRVDQIGS